MYLLLPDDDEALLLRSELHQYGFPRPATFAKWACRPSEAPCEIPYILVGRRAAYRVGNLRRLREKLTFRNSTERTVRRDGRAVREKER